MQTNSLQTSASVAAATAATQTTTAAPAALAPAATAGAASASSNDHSLLRMLRPALVGFVLLSAVTGLLYPAAVTGLAKLLFPQQAAGSLVEQNGHLVGSALIGQNFSAPRYFWGRPSATGPMANNAANSSGSNQGPTNTALVDAVKGRIDALRAADPGNTAPVPVDLVSASASGLDPHISMAAARYQAGRVARERGLSLEAVQRLIQTHTEARDLAVLGEPRVNVLLLNLALDREPGQKVAVPAAATVPAATAPAGTGPAATAPAGTEPAAAASAP
ncbi:K+-transporting ATPase ATPase C chain [Roseateles sp. YR242]|nr:K+-transporting ATPase ATPase C chain [Roseateles sp. YR242]